MVSNVESTRALRYDAWRSNVISKRGHSSKQLARIQLHALFCIPAGTLALSSSSVARHEANLITINIMALTSIIVGVMAILAASYFLFGSSSIKRNGESLRYVSRPIMSDPLVMALYTLRNTQIAGS